MRWWKWLLVSVGILLVIAAVIFGLTKQFVTVSENNLPKFIQANAVDPSVVTTVSKFRSTAGHSNPGWPESCRSMKHYITVYDPAKTGQQITMSLRGQTPTADAAITIFSPVSGRISKQGTGEGDDQLNISVDGYRGWSIRFEHVHLLPTISRFNAHVSAGEPIATVWNVQNFDLSVFYHYYRGDELFSYFEVLPPNLFAAWQAQGATTTDEFVFTKAYRDAHPATCLNDRKGTPSFADPSGQVTENWVPENFVRLKPDYDPQHPR
ncbi:MAG TPA: hypothetical protein VLE93_00860 [Candidatus Saccharimonadales bacterium]|nr:hypothetical protein [Candidatus Saccharimonadales bacterium]